MLGTYYFKFEKSVYKTLSKKGMINQLFIISKYK